MLSATTSTTPNINNNREYYYNSRRTNSRRTTVLSVCPSRYFCLVLSLSSLYLSLSVFFSGFLYLPCLSPVSLSSLSLSLSSSPSRHLDSIGCRINPTYTLLILLLYTYCVKPPTADLLLCCDKPTADPLLHCGKRSAANLLKSTATRLHNSILRQTY